MLLNQELFAHVLPGLQADLAFNLTLPAATPPGLPGILETLGGVRSACKRARLFRLRKSELTRIARYVQLFLRKGLNVDLRGASRNVFVVRIDLFDTARRRAGDDHPVVFELGARNVPLGFAVPGISQQQRTFSRGPAIKRNYFERTGVTQLLNIRIACYASTNK